MSRSVKLLATAFAASVLTGAYVVYRHKKIDELGNTALCGLCATASAKSAIEKLATYRGSWATDVLLRVATADREFIDGRQDSAILAVARRGDATVSGQLAALLQPFNGLARREAVARALEENTCNEPCAVQVLHYLERYWYGYGKQEDYTLLAMGSDSSEMESEESSLNDRLDSVLLRNDKATLSVLRSTYGLGSPAPSTFALHIVQSLRLRGACPLIWASKEDLIDASKQEKLATLLNGLGCLPETEKRND